MGGRFSNITEQYKTPEAFLEKLEKINSRMQACDKAIDTYKENSIAGRIQKALGRDPHSRMAACREEWHKAAGYLHPFIKDNDGKPAYLDSFLKENHLRSSIHTDFYHVPENKINTAYSFYESQCTVDHSWLVKRDAATRMDEIIPDRGELWTHISHSGAQQIAEQGIAINTIEDAGRVNLERNLTHYGDMGHVMAALNTGIGYKGADHIFLCDIPDAEQAKVNTEEDRAGHARSSYLAPEYICAVLTIENGKITDACTREEFLERFREEEIGSYSWDDGREPERELSLELSHADSQDRSGDSIEMEEEDLEL